MGGPTRRVRSLLVDSSRLRLGRLGWSVRPAFTHSRPLYLSDRSPRPCNILIYVCELLQTTRYARPNSDARADVGGWLQQCLQVISVLRPYLWDSESSPSSGLSTRPNSAFHHPPSSKHERTIINTMHYLRRALNSPTKARVGCSKTCSCVVLAVIIANKHVCPWIQEEASYSRAQADNSVPNFPRYGDWIGIINHPRASRYLRAWCVCGNTRTRRYTFPSSRQSSLQ
ncbi:hypothetical protein CYLTODRAFT_421813 [Cylindrobasidium torrendii FP15055 ss-10]|uniref:Uncharacterized protein n=1 Tax=Cylindrobasidium torrendii FP15055 ss-10 TaxID=1314674 RepID=A0A0D7BDF0_9AGAR|nr:hypothetical protein CYLTODRAFT_421813 [Cylindrobasidium torrendii FP15055 ss-10]